MRESRSLTTEEAEGSWAILVALAGARDEEDSRREFVRYASKGHGIEYRFQGVLGFGGKFYWDGLKARVGFYSESRTELREAIRDCVNRRLAILLGYDPAPAPDPLALLEACVCAMERTSRAQADLERLRFARMDEDRAARPKAKEVRQAETGLRMTRDGLDAAALRAREALRKSGLD